MGEMAPEPTWVRAVARIVGDDIVLDDMTTEEYPVRHRDAVLWDLLALTDEADVARFASRHGLLRARDGMLRESLASWWLERDVLRGTLALAFELHAAGRQGAEALERVERDWNLTASGGQTGGEGAGMAAFDAVVRAVERGLGSTHVIFGVAVGDADNGASLSFALQPSAATLLGLAYLEVARLVTGETLLGRCPECGLVFVVKHRRQAYCSPQHANRARLRRFRERQGRTVPSRASAD